MGSIQLKIRHWVPIVTFCPVNGLPDFVYVTVEFESFMELYSVRRLIRKTINGKKMFMEDCAGEVLKQFPSAKSVTVTLMFNRHVVTLKRED